LKFLFHLCTVDRFKFFFWKWVVFFENLTTLRDDYVITQLLIIQEENSLLLERKYRRYLHSPPLYLCRIYHYILFIFLHISHLHTFTAHIYISPSLEAWLSDDENFAFHKLIFRPFKKKTKRNEICPSNNDTAAPKPKEAKTEIAKWDFRVSLIFKFYIILNVCAGNCCVISINIPILKTTTAGKKCCNYES
jgi:hypothetical protein